MVYTSIDHSNEVIVLNILRRYFYGLEEYRPWEIWSTCCRTDQWRNCACAQQLVRMTYASKIPINISKLFGFGLFLKVTANVIFMVSSTRALVKLFLWKKKHTHTTNFNVTSNRHQITVEPCLTTTLSAQSSLPFFYPRSPSLANTKPWARN